MERREMEELLVGYLYGELSSDERNRVEREMARDPEWEERLEEMRGASGLLRKMEEPEMGVRTAWTALPERRSSREKVRAPLRLRSRMIGSVAVGVAAALLLILGNARIGVEEGRFTFSLGRAGGPATVWEAPDGGVPLQLASGGPAAAPGGDYITREDFLRGQAELVRFVASLIEESEDRQADRFLTAFREYVEGAEEERHGEMLLMDQRLGEMEESARDIRDRIDREPSGTNVRTPGEDRR